MPPQATETAKTLRPYLFHGVELRADSGNVQALGTCPWCGRERKFGVNAETGLWRCYVCNVGSDNGKAVQGGNARVFLRLLHQQAARTTTDYAALAADRRLLFGDTLRAWGVVDHPLLGGWAAPGYSVDGKLDQLWRWVSDGQRMKFLPTPGLGTEGHCYFAEADRAGKRDRPKVYLCEGLWDSCALWEVLRTAKRADGGGLALTGNAAGSLAAEADVVGFPNCGSVGEPMKRWLGIFAGRDVVIMPHSDHPTEHGGQRHEGAGWAALKRAVKLLAEAEEPPNSISYLHWGDDGYDPALKSGYDVRDWLTTDGDAVATAAGRVRSLQSLLEHVRPVPEDWTPGRHVDAGHVGEMDLEPCYDFARLVSQWRKPGAMRWGPELNDALTLSLACAMTTDCAGHGQLWMKLLGPPSCGKSTIAEALAVAKSWVVAKSTFANVGIISAYQVDAEGSENMSLLEQLKGKTLVIKDGDTLLKAPNRDRILSQLRDAYDKAIRSSAGNRMSKDFEGYNFTLTIWGTKSLRELDQSELGQRFLDYVVFHEIDEDVEDAVSWRVLNQAANNMALRSNGRPETQDNPDKVLAKRMTGGYLDHLRRRAQDIFSGIQAEEAELRTLQRYAKFVSYMRARPSKNKEAEVTADREMSYRLAEQMVRLGFAVAGVWGRSTLDADVMRLVHKVTMDTATGRVLNVCRAMHAAEQRQLRKWDKRRGMTNGSIAGWANEPVAETTHVLQFLRRIKAVETVSQGAGTNSSNVKYRLTQRLHDLFGAVAGPPEPDVPGGV